MRASGGRIDGRDDARNSGKRKNAFCKISKIRDRQKSKLLQTSLAAFALQSAAFIFVAVGDKV
jgi:hypothetical protein